MRIWLITEAKSFSSYSHEKLFKNFSKNHQIDFYSPDEIFISIDSSKLEITHSNGTELEHPDFVIPRTSTEKALNLFSTLEEFKVPLLNSTKSIFIAKDKLRTASFLAAHNFPIPKTESFQQDQKITYPCVLKKNVSSRGRNIFLLKKNTDYISALSKLIPNKEYLLQEYMKDSHGKDVRTMVIGGKIIGSILRKSNQGFLANISQNGSAEEITLNKDVQKMILDAVKALKINYVGVDLLFDKTGFKFCEFNYAADFKGFEEATDISISNELLKFILKKTK